MAEIIKRDIEKREIRYRKAVDEMLAENAAISIMDNSIADLDTMYDELYVLTAGDKILSRKIFNFNNAATTLILNFAIKAYKAGRTDESNIEELSAPPLNEEKAASTIPVAETASAD